MLERFRHKVEELRGLIADLRSASVSMGQGGSQGCRKNPSHFVGPSPCGQGGSTLSAPLTATSDNRCLLAVSGGMDSMCMADLWLRCFGAGSFAIAHCNFHLRGEESDGDEALVTKWAEENGVRMHRVDFDTVGYAADNGLSIEMAARELRYRWFGELCLEYGYEAVVVAHHADDNAETLVLNMVRGAGLKGLTGMKPISPLPLQQKPGQAGLDAFRHPRPSRHPRPDRGSLYVFRPLLTFTRKQIEGHVFAWKVPYREDSTNSSVEYRRNSIRHEVFPLLERMNPSYVRTLNREMTYLSDASSIVEEWCRAQLPDVVTFTDSRTDCGLHWPPSTSWAPRPSCLPEPPSCHPERSEGSLVINLPALLAKPHWRYLLYYILEPYGFNSQTLESLEDLLASERTVSGKRFESQDWVLRTERQSLLLVPKMAGQAGHDGAARSCHDGAMQAGHVGAMQAGHDGATQAGHDGATQAGHDGATQAGHDGAARSGHDGATQAGHDGPVILGRPVIPDLIGDPVNLCRPVIPDLIGDPFIPVRAAGTYHCNGQRFLVEVLSWSEDMPLKQPPGVLIFDAAKLKFPFVCRKWRQGDWLVPLGMKGRKKVSDLFADLKYGSFEKEAALMIVDCAGERAEQQRVAGVLGVRMDKDYKVSAETEDIIRITLLNDN